MDLMGLFDSLDQGDKRKIVHAPFGWLGSKDKSLKYILPLLPYRRAYIEPYGGSGAVLLARDKSAMEVFNDKYAGIVALYRCLRDADKTNKLSSWLENTVYSREEFLNCRDTWNNVDDEIERAGRWLYSTVYSFNTLGKVFGRDIKRQTMAGRLQRKVPELFGIHQRLKNVLIENMDALDLLHDYDAYDSVFYLDPPYICINENKYESNMTHDDHRRLLNYIFSMKSFVALSGYHNTLYDEQDWDAIHEWEVVCLAENRVSGLNPAMAYKDSRETVKEVLFIKEAGG